MKGDCTPLPRSYSGQYHYSRVIPTQYRGTHHQYQPTPSPWDESHTQDGDPSSWYNRGSKGGPFYLQGPEPIHASIGQIASELKRVSAQVTRLEEAGEERTKAIEQILDLLEAIDTRISAIEGGVGAVLY